jgi:tRNA(Glu) U13 pseudouridine synthase TruD
MYKQFQSLLWNKLLNKILQNQNPKQIVIDKSTNQLFNIDKIRNHTFYLPNPKSNYLNYQQLFESILAEYNLNQSELDILPKSKRDLFFFSKHISQTKYKDYSILEFELPKGCYATLVIKQLYLINYQIKFNQ